MEDLEIEIKDGTPLLHEYVVALNELAFKYRQINGTVQDSELLNLLQTRGKEILVKHPILRNHTHFVAMVQQDNPMYDTWDKQLSLHSALQDIVAEERSAEEYKKHLDSYGSKTSVFSTTMSKSKMSGAQPVANAAVKAQFTLPVVTNTSILRTAHCLIYPNGKHLNSDCNDQTSIRKQKLKQDQLITVIRELQKRIDKQKAVSQKECGVYRKQQYLESKRIG